MGLAQTWSLRACCMIDDDERCSLLAALTSYLSSAHPRATALMSVRAGLQAAAAAEAAARIRDDDRRWRDLLFVPGRHREWPEGLQEGRA